MADFAKMKVSELKDELASRGLLQTGTKQKLLERLTQFIEDEKLIAGNHTSADAGEDAVEGGAAESGAVDVDAAAPAASATAASTNAAATQEASEAGSCRAPSPPIAHLQQPPPAVTS